MKIGDRVRRTNLVDGHESFFDIERQEQIDYLKTFHPDKYQVTVVNSSE